MSIQDEITRISGQVIQQTDLIGEIKDALIGKGAGGSGGGIKDIYDPESNPIEQGNVTTSTGADAASSTRLRAKGYIEVKPFSVYKLYSNLRVLAAQYTESKAAIENTGWKITPLILQTATTCKYIRLVLSNTSNSAVSVEDLEYLKIEALEGNARLQEKAVTPTTSVQEVVPDLNYDGLSKVTVEAIPEDMIIPSGTLEVSTNGTYDVRDKETVSVDVHDIEDAIMMNTITGAYVNDRVTKVGGYHFLLAAYLTSVSMSNVTSTGTNSFQQCTSLVDVNLPKLGRASNYIFYGCSALTKLDLPSAGAIGPMAFSSCSSLTAVIFRKTTAIVNLENANAFNKTPIADGTGYVYVPAALVDTYKTASNWTTYANQIRAIEDYPDICG